MKRSLFTSYLRFETSCTIVLCGFGGMALFMRAIDNNDPFFYSLVAGALVVTAAALLFRAARRL